MKVEERFDGEPCWFDLMTPDREVAKAFYAAVFGWEFDDRDEAGMPYSMATKRGGPVAGIGPLPKDAPYPSAWTTYFQSPDVDAQCGAVKAAGGQVMVGPTEVPTQGKMAICTDPEGGAFGLWQPSGHKGSAYVGEHGSMCWCEANMRDAEKGSEFYAQLFGAKAEKQPFEGMTYYILQSKKRDYPQAGVLQMTEEWGDMPAHWMAYFAVDDADAACDAIKANGGDVRHGPFDTPFGRIAVVADPGGAHFTVMKPTSGAH